MFHRPQAVLFDAVGTLLAPEPSAALAYLSIGRRMGSLLKQSEAATRFREAFRRQEAIDRQVHGLRTNEARERQRWREIVAEVLFDVKDQEQAFAALWKHFAEPENWRVAPDGPLVWQELSRRGLTLGIASNFDRRLEPLCQAIEPLPQCRHVFTSSELGWRKPSPEFFAAIEDRLGLKGSELLLVGDDLENDYLAARACGWQAILIDPRGKTPVEMRISRLGELLSFLPVG
jgi:putative hydrolase of the HAD superfamily